MFYKKVQTGCGLIKNKSTPIGARSRARWTTSYCLFFCFLFNQEFLCLFDIDGDGKVTLDEYERALGLKEVPETT